MSDDDLFKSEMQGVKPISNDRANIDKSASNSPSLAQIAAKQAATATKLDDINPLTMSDVEPVNPQDPIEFCRPGVQHGVYKNLRLGKYDVEARIDLHGYTLEKALDEVYRFISDCHKYGLRTVSITHGKGVNSKPFAAFLKSYTAKWLKEIPEVMAYHSCMPRHGGTGSVYILIQKSDEKKLANSRKY